MERNVFKIMDDVIAATKQIYGYVDELQKAGAIEEAKKLRKIADRLENWECCNYPIAGEYIKD